MDKLSIFSYREASDLILEFYTYVGGVWEDELDQLPEVKKLVELGYTEKSEEYEQLIVLSQEGANFLHLYIKSISEKFINHMKNKGLEMSVDDTARWFKDEFELLSIEDGEDIAYYICRNLYHYGYRVGNCHSRRKGDFYRLDPIKPLGK